MLALGVIAVASSCGSERDEDEGKKGGGVGASCTNDAQCTGYANPACLTDLRPLETLVAPDAGEAGEVFKMLDVPFPGGYCSNTIENSCQTDADCGPGGGCYRPLTGVPAEQLATFDALVGVFSVTTFASKGLCLVPCASDSDCRTDEGYQCLLPLEGFISLVNPSYTKTYCAQDVDVSYLLVTPDAG
jgi:hypothetical protein